MKIAYYRNTNNTTNFANAHVKHVPDFDIDRYTNDVNPRNILRKTYYFLDTNTGEGEAPILYIIGKLVQHVVNYHGEQELVFTNKKVMIIIPAQLIDTHLYVRITNSPNQAGTKKQAAQPTHQAEVAAQYGGKRVTRKTRKTI